MTDATRILSLRTIVMLLFFIVLVPMLPVLISRRWGWWEAWVYAAVGILGFAGSRLLAARRNPGVIRERARFLDHENTEPWDKVLAPLVGLGGLLIPLVAGLDALHGWSPALPLAVRLIALFVMLFGYWLAVYAFLANRFFSGIVRIQTERDHQVVSSGPYRWLRHPGYTGSLVAYFATPLLLATLWAFIPVLLLALVLALRTALEDRTLQQRLAGYEEYAARVRYRLVPGIW